MLQAFLLHLLSLELSRKTLRTHRDNLWILGGEMIRDFHEDPPLRKRPLETWLGSVIDDEGGRYKAQLPVRLDHQTTNMG